MDTTATYVQETDEQRFDTITRAITDNATNALFLMNNRGVCTFLNPAAESMFGYTLDELQEKPLHDYIHHKYPDGSSFPIHECPIGHTVFSLNSLKSYEDTFIRKDGSFLAVKCSAKPITKNGLLTGILLEVRDITEERNAAKAIKDSEERYRTLAINLEQIVNERTQELQRSNDDLLQFAHVASHDLKEPVRKILLYADLIQRSATEKLNVEENTFLSKIIKAGERLTTMIEGVLKYSTANGTEQNIERVDLNKIMEDITHDLELIALNKGATIQYEGLPSIEGARILLYQLFYNMVNNSLKFTLPGQAPKITLNAKPLGDYIEIAIRDNGIGFDQAYAEKIFDPFTRLNNKDQFEGTGLGLALCKKIVQRHRGTISAVSSKGEGAAFVLVLPIRQSGTLL